MNLSIVIPTYKRSNDLHRLLESIFQQTAPVMEVLVIVGPGDEEGLAIAYEWQARQPAAIKVLPSARKSVVHALNMGLPQTKGDIICMLDDDVWLPPGWAARIAAAYRADATLGAYGGRDRLQLNDPRFDNPPLAAKVGCFRWDGVLEGNHHCGAVVSPARVDVIKGCNMSFRRTALANLSVDPALESQGAEVCSEVDICQRIIQAGYYVVYDNDNYVLHYSSARPDSDNRSDLFSPSWENRTYNEALVTAKYRPLSELTLLGMRYFLVGNRLQPGLLWSALLLVQHPSWKLLKLPWHYAGIFYKGAADGWRRRASANSNILH